ncbi:hypothetical protein GCM10008110_02030 [Marinobacter persicus]|nr:hypothetical protein GCM10008110_02030 [Marinobacter persicus]
MGARDKLAAVAGYGPKAIMLNCCDPEILTAAMPELAGRHLTSNLEKELELIRFSQI